MNFKNLITKIFSHTLFRGSMIMFAGTTVVNAGNYLFHLLMGRMLGPSEYGILASIISSLYIINIVPLALNVAIVKFVSSAQGKGHDDEISAFYYWLQKKIIVFGLGVTVILFFLIPAWSAFLKIVDPIPLVLIALTFPLLVLLMVLRSFFTGVLNFTAYSLSTITEVILKIVLSVILVYLGFSVTGVVVASLLSLIGTYAVSANFLKFKTAGKSAFFEHKKELLLYTLPVILSAFSLNSLFSTDIVLVKHFFSSFEAGIYASLSVLGKIIFFASSSLVAVMFPLVSQKHARGENYRRVFWLTFGIIAIASFFLTVVYLLFPKLMISLLFGSKYLAGANLLFWFGVFLAFYSLASVMISFFLSLGKTKAVVFPLISAGMQVLFITIWHQNLQIVIFDSIIATFILLVSLLLYYPYATKK